MVPIISHERAHAVRRHTLRFTAVFSMTIALAACQTDSGAPPVLSLE